MHGGVIIALNRMSSSPVSSQTLLLSLDLLGFSVLVEEHPNQMETVTYDLFDRYEGDGEVLWRKEEVEESTRSEDVFSRFHNVLAAEIEHPYRGVAQAFVFSDGAFLACEHPNQTVATARQLMRNFLGQELPVRMGLGYGTLHTHKFSAEMTPKLLVARSIFYGTAVINAHRAQQQKGRGSRIFVHKSCVPVLKVSHPLFLRNDHDESGEVPLEVNCLFDSKRVKNKKILLPPQQNSQLVADIQNAIRDPANQTDEGKEKWLDTLVAFERMRKESPKWTNEDAQ